ncbi:angiopoietin-related protein 7-like [Zeugodacus cucurbitae]|uniref:angiopoietin-related protein 7-like n=1 Tax=Zeugodacus cucurbitae TaxID=28588 RepID=UPI0023D95A14|nr:angiopoietin-related protein 7-like [Zeugodacus cucurbitae]
MAHRFLYFYCTCAFILHSQGCDILLQVNSQTPVFSNKLCDDAVSTIKELNNKLTDLQNELLTIRKRDNETNSKCQYLKLIESHNEGYKIILTTAKKCSTSCAEAMRQPNGTYAASGVYELYLAEFFSHPFQVYCLQDPDGGEPWAIIQRRQSRETDFDRDWIDYEHGFGDLNANLFLGLDKIHALTQSRPHEL